jgi:hypothetical protein
MHQYLKKLDFVTKLVSMLKFHKQPQVVSAVCATLNEVSKLPLFYQQLVGEMQLDIMLQTLLKQTSDESLLDVLIKVMEMTKVPIKFFIAAKILKISEMTPFIEALSPIKVVALLKILYYISSRLDN